MCAKSLRGLLRQVRRLTGPTEWPVLIVIALPPGDEPEGCNGGEAVSGAGGR